MFNEHKCEEGQGGNNTCCGQDLMGLLDGCTPECKREFIIAKLEKKAAIMKIEAEFLQKMKAMLEKTEPNN